ncbi:hypothetical protein ACN2XU_09615 [Primorskyibacter sp. 2E107]
MYQALTDKFVARVIVVPRVNVMVGRASTEVRLREACLLARDAIGAARLLLAERPNQG